MTDDSSVWFSAKNQNHCQNNGGITIYVGRVDYGQQAMQLLETGTTCMLRSV
jgi:hypothetical protein